jgi:drug/metabolite transporter (DMT)-like permease
LAIEAFVRRTPLLAAAMWTNLAASVSLGAYALLSGQAPELRRSEEWAILIALAGLGAAGFYFLFHGIRRLGAVRASITVSLEPFFVAALAFAFLGETLPAGVVAGGLLILAASVAVSYIRSVPQTGAGLP